MTTRAEHLDGIDRMLSDALSDAAGQPSASGADQVATLLALGRIQRRIDGAITACADEIATEDARVERSARLTSQVGCRDVAELLRRALRVDGHTARRYVAAAAAVHRELSVTSGEMLPTMFPGLATALAEGELSLTGFLACTEPLRTNTRIRPDDRAVADALLARFALGLPLDDDAASADDDAASADDDAASADGIATDAADDAARGPAPTTDELAGLAAHLVSRLDPDGAVPADDAGARRRFLTIGKLRDGTVPVRGELLPDVATQLQRLIDSLLNPKAAGSGGDAMDTDSAGAGAIGDGIPDTAAPDDFDRLYGDVSDDELAVARAERSARVRHAAPPEEYADLRTHAQKRHDALATALTVAAASGGMPRIGGAAPTLVVTVRADDYAARTGRARLEGTGYDVPLGVADHAACSGLVQRVLQGGNGAVIGTGITGRIFTAGQRRAIIARDRQCLIPGCGIAAEWCEIHHVVPWARGGPTRIENGVPLCWHHHRTIDTGAWVIRMVDGMPQIRGPGWWDPYGLWRSPHLGYVATEQHIDDAVERERARVYG